AQRCVSRGRCDGDGRRGWAGFCVRGGREEAGAGNFVARCYPGGPVVGTHAYRRLRRRDGVCVSSWIPVRPVFIHYFRVFMRKAIAFLTVLLGFLTVFGLTLVAGKGAFEISTAQAHQTASSTLVVHVKPETGEIDQFLSVPARDLAHDLGVIAESETPQASQLLAVQDKIVAALGADLTVRNNGQKCETIEENLVML